MAHEKILKIDYDNNLHARRMRVPMEPMTDEIGMCILVYEYDLHYRSIIMFYVLAKREKYVPITME
jgi:hypothetical protein